MAELETALYSILTAHTGLMALVSTDGAARIYPEGEVPQDCSMPYVTYRRISGPREHAMGRDPGLAHPRMEVSAWDDDKADCRAVATQVRLALQDWTGTQDGVVIQRIFLDGDHDVYNEETWSSGIGCDFIIWHLE
jgi:hypothetical protein